MGVVPAKPLKRILEEQERREKYTQGKASQSAKASSQADCQAEGNNEEAVVKELLLNKERCEYEEMLNALEGDGEISQGWRDLHSPAQPRKVRLPGARFPGVGISPMSNLRLQKIPGVRSFLGGDDLVGFKLPALGGNVEQVGPLDSNLSQASFEESSCNTLHGSRDKGSLE